MTAGATAVMSASLATAANNQIGEAPVWDVRRRRLVWVDHGGGSVHSAQQVEGAWRETRRWALGRHLAAALPSRNDGHVIVGAADVTRMDEDGRLEPLADAPFDQSAMRFNEAKCDARGRLWAGAMAADLGACGAVYCLDEEGRWRTMVSGARLANGMDWSPDGARFYFVDSMAQTLDQFECDLERLALGRRQTLIDFSGERGSPNGMCVDRGGGLWVAVTGAGEVRGYWPDGALKARIKTPTPCVTSCVFGGDDGRTLFITSRSGRLPDFALSFGLSDDELECAGDAAGALYLCRPGVAGPPAHPILDGSGISE